MNSIKDSLKAGKTVVGTAGSPSVDTGMLADAGYDFLLFDTQHAAVDTKQLHPSIQAMIGKKVGEYFTLEIRGKETKFTITAIERISEATPKSTIKD